MKLIDQPRHQIRTGQHAEIVGCGRVVMILRLFQPSNVGRLDVNYSAPKNFRSGAEEASLGAIQVSLSCNPLNGLGSWVRNARHR